MFLALVVATALMSGLGAMVEGSEEQDEVARDLGPPPGLDTAGLIGISPQTRLVDDDFRRMYEGGVDVLRYGLTWDNVQAHPGRCRPQPQIATCQWAEFDTIVGAAAVSGIRIFPTLGGRPEFTEDEDSDEFVREHPPVEGEALDAWRSFVRAAAARYGRGGTFWEDFEKEVDAEPVPITEWQVWNEPNAAAYWPPKPDPREYATLVEATATALREADPQAEIVLGGMFGTATVTSRDFLRSLYDVEGIEDHFDSIAIHPYSSDVDGIEVQAEWVRDSARRAGDDEVGLWATEVGVGSGSGEHPIELGDEGQARFLHESFELFLKRREAWDVEGVVWFTWKDEPDGTVCRFCETAGLFDETGGPKPAWQVYRRYGRATDK